MAIVVALGCWIHDDAGHVGPLGWLVDVGVFGLGWLPDVVKDVGKFGLGWLLDVVKVVRRRAALVIVDFIRHLGSWIILKITSVSRSIQSTMHARAIINTVHTINNACASDY